MNKLICPYCFSEVVAPPRCSNSQCRELLPARMLGASQRFFSIVGSTESGKSHYIAILIEQMKRQALNFGWSFFALNDETMDLYESRFHRPLYENRAAILKTAPGAAETRRPLIYSLRFVRETEIRDVSLIFYDASGEIFNAESSMNRAARYLYNSAGIVFLLDPLQFPYVVERFHSEFPNEALPSKLSANASAGALFARVVNFLSVRRNDRGKIAIPIAIVLSKIDALRFLFTEESPCFLPSLHRRGISVSDFRRINDYLRNFMMTIDTNREILGNTSQFERCGFFGVSALGQNPRNQRLRFPPRPIRILDPILWLLWQNGLIEG